MFGVREAEIRDDIREVLALCGVPPYLPHNYFVFQIEGDRVRIKFAEHLKRPIRLTLQEALAIVLALKGVGRGRVPPFGDAAERLREKIRASLRGDDRVVLETLDRSVTGIETRRARDRDDRRSCARRCRRNVAARITYYTAGRDAESEREIEPYGLVDHRRRLVRRREGLDPRARASVPRGPHPDRRADEREYLVPDDFTAERYRREEMYEQAGDEVRGEGPLLRARRRTASSSRRPRRTSRSPPDGGVVRTFRTGPRSRWLYAFVARFGPDAEVLGPPEHRKGMMAYLDSMLDAAGEARATAAARAKPSGPARTKRKPR